MKAKSTVNNSLIDRTNSSEPTGQLLFHLGAFQRNMIGEMPEMGHVYVSMHICVCAALTEMHRNTAAIAFCLQLNLVQGVSSACL